MTTLTQIMVERSCVTGLHVPHLMVLQDSLRHRASRPVAPGLVLAGIDELKEVQRPHLYDARLLVCRSTVRAAWLVKALVNSSVRHQQKHQQGAAQALAKRVHPAHPAGIPQRPTHTHTHTPEGHFLIVTLSVTTSVGVCVVGSQVDLTSTVDSELTGTAPQSQNLVEFIDTVPDQSHNPRMVSGHGVKSPKPLRIKDTDQHHENEHQDTVDSHSLERVLRGGTLQDCQGVA